MWWLQWRILQREHDLKDRMMAQRALGLQLLDQLLEWDILVGVGLQRALSDPRQQIAKHRIPGQVRAQRQRVDEEADQRLDLGMTSIGNR